MPLLLRRREFLAGAFATALPTLSGADRKRIPLGVTTDEIDDDPAIAAAFLKEFGLSFAEVRNVWGAYNTSQPLEKIRELRKIFDAHGIRTSVLGTAFFKIPLPPPGREGDAILDNQWALLNSAMERAAMLGTDKIRTFGFTRKEGDVPDAEAYPRIYELVRESARRAKARGFRLALENVGGSFVSTGAEAGELLKAVKEDALGLTWDPNNAGRSGENAFPEGYGKLDPGRIFHVHLRDYRRTADGKREWCAVGKGEMDNLGQLRSLLKAGYTGSFTLETHYTSPLGKAHASRTSLTALLKVIDQV